MRNLAYGWPSALLSTLLLTAACGGRTTDTGETNNDDTANDDSTQSDDEADDNSDPDDASADDADDADDDAEDDTTGALEDDDDDFDDSIGDTAAGADDNTATASDDSNSDPEIIDAATDDDVEPPAPSGPRVAPPIDLLFVVDNSRLMRAKQDLLALAIPDLINRLLAPVCVDSNGRNVAQPPADMPCPAGSEREFEPLTDVHVGVITTSLGGYGASLDCSGDTSFSIDGLQQTDMAELLGSLPRGAAVSPSSASSGFLSWTASTDNAAYSAELTGLVQSAGEYGCGFEAPLEAWYRFLIDPFPYTRIVRRGCNAMDTAMSCAGPEMDPGSNAQLVSERILAQRAAFMRPDSVLAVFMLSDENDCSFKASGQTWRLAQTVQSNEEGSLNYYGAFRGTAACNDPAMGPNHECCHSCGQASVPSACPTAPDADGLAVAVGCENGRKFTIDENGDNPNLRCFEQKRRFGVDYLYPVERYSTALRSPQICPFSDNLGVEGCPADPVANPLFADLSVNPNANKLPAPARDPNDVFLVGILGVPWQDLVVDHNAAAPEYRVARKDVAAEQRINWDWILGARQTASGLAEPVDPLMRESVQPRQGMVPSTGESLAAPDSTANANSSNGHEWNIYDESQIQYACTFPTEERACPSISEAGMLAGEGESVAPCQCTETPGDDWGNPLCQAADGSFDNVERGSGAHPGIRQLQVLYDFGDNAVVASICPWNLDQQSGASFGYRPAMNAFVERLRERLE